MSATTKVREDVVLQKLLDINESTVSPEGGARDECGSLETVLC
jgi:hypothetical protein